MPFRAWMFLQAEAGRERRHIVNRPRIHSKPIPGKLQLKLMQFAMDNASIEIYWVNRDARIDYANNCACTVLGYTKDELLHLSIPDLDPNYPMEDWGQHWQSLQHDRTQAFETMHKRKDGKLFPVEVIVNYVEFDGYEYNVGFAKDITTRKHADDSLRESEEFFRTISENIDDFIAVLDLEGRRLYNNRSYINILGSLEALRGTDSFSEVHPEDRERVRELFHKTVRTGVGERAEFRFLLPDGSVRYMESSGALLRSTGGAPMRVLVVSRDITERKLAESKIYDLAFYDPLSQLPNRRLLRDRLDKLLALSQRSGHYNALMFIDLDNFKPLNDMYGHKAGDSLLVEAALRLKSCVREMDTVARFGGDEFVVLLSELDAIREAAMHHAASVAEKIRLALAMPYRITVRTEDNEDRLIEHECTSSIGVALFGQHHANPDEIIHHADQAMYRAKEGGRNKVCFHQKSA